MINIKNNATAAKRLSDINSSQRREVSPMSLNALSTENLTPVKGNINRTTQGNYNANPAPQYQSQNTARPVPPPVQQTQRQTSPVQPAQVSHTPPPAPVRPAVKRPPLPPAQKLLRKGEKYSITKNHPSSLSFCVGLGWESAGPINYDVDIEAFMLNETEKVPDDSWIVFYGQLRSPDGAVIHNGDSSEGKSFGADCEQININLRAIDKRISKIAIVMTINEAKIHHYNFSGLKNAYIRFTDTATGKELFRYELTDYYREVVSMVVGELYFRNNEWRFNPVGMGTDDDLEGLCNRYGIEVK